MDKVHFKILKYFVSRGFSQFYVKEIQNNFSNVLDETIFCKYKNNQKYNSNTVKKNVNIGALNFFN